MSRLKSIFGVSCCAAMRGRQNKTITKASAANTRTEAGGRNSWRLLNERICVLVGGIDLCLILSGQWKGFKAYSLAWLRLPFPGPRSSRGQSGTTEQRCDDAVTLYPSASRPRRLSLDG